MLIYNTHKKTKAPSLQEVENGDALILFANPEEIHSIEKTLGIASAWSLSHSANESIRFESHNGYDFISFIFFKIIAGEFVFQEMQVYHAKNFLMIVFEGSPEDFEKSLTALLNHPEKQSSPELLAVLCYRFISKQLIHMLDTLSEYEEMLNSEEQLILKDVVKYDFENIVYHKGTSFTIKKYLRFFLHVGDRITENENGLIPESLSRNFEAIDLRINRLYEFSEQIHEMTEHLMDLYDSRITDRTNNLINKLTIFTVFAAPLTVISGIYGMNFTNMPELQHQNGYFIALGVMGLCLVTTYVILKRIKLL